MYNSSMIGVVIQWKVCQEKRVSASRQGELLQLGVGAPPTRIARTTVYSSPQVCCVIVVSCCIELVLLVLLVIALYYRQYVV